MALETPYFAHQSAYIDSPCRIGMDTEIWHFSHVMINSRIGNGCRIGQRAIIPSGCKIGDAVQIHDNVILAPGTVLEDGVVCATSVVFSIEARPNAGNGRWPGRTPAVVRTGAKIGAHATVLGGVTLGRHCAVQAGTVVTADVPDHAVAAGNPMRLIGWVCGCGERLEFGAENDYAAVTTCCARCGDAHLKQGQQVEPLAAQATGPAAKLNVPLLDAQAQYASIRAETEAALQQVCARQQFTLGPQTARLEQQLAEFSGCAYASGVASGSDALLLALAAVGVDAGDEVITTPYAHLTAAGAILRLGARPVFCDIEPNTYNLSAAAVGDFIAADCELRDGQLFNRRSGAAVKALLPVHLFGLCADMESLLSLAGANALRVVEDASLALGAEIGAGRRAGGLGDIGCFSFAHDQSLGAFGEAGLCTTNDPALAERLRALRDQHGPVHPPTAGGSFRLGELQAAALNVKLGRLEDWIEQRRRNAADYDRAFAQVDIDEQLSTPWSPAGYRHVYSRYTIRVKQRDELRRFLTDVGITTEVCFSPPLPAQVYFAGLNYRPTDLPETYAAAAETLVLPIYPELTWLQKTHVTDNVIALLR